MLNSNNENSLELPLVLALTINYNQSIFTINCVESLLASDYPNLKVYVLDNGSTQQEMELLEKHISSNVKLFYSQQNLGYAKGINYLLQLCSKMGATYFLILNNDTVIDKLAVSALVYCCARMGNECIASGKVYEYDDPNRLQYVGGKYIVTKYLINHNICRCEIDKCQYDIESERDMLDDIFWLLPSAIYQQIGGYNEDFFMYAEQDDYALRAKKAGFKLIYTPLAKIWHKGGLSSGGNNTENLFVLYHKTRSLLIFRYIHLERIYFIQSTISFITSVLTNDLILEIIFAIKNHRKARLKQTFVKIKAIVDFARYLIRKSQAK